MRQVPPINLPAVGYMQSPSLLQDGHTQHSPDMIRPLMPNMEMPRPLLSLDLSRMPPTMDVNQNQHDMYRQQQDVNMFPSGNIFRNQDMLPRPGMFDSDMRRLGDFRDSNEDMHRVHDSPLESRWQDQRQRRDRSPHRGRGYMGPDYNEDSRSSYNQDDSQHMRSNFGNGDYPDNDNWHDGDSRNNDEGNWNDWNDEMSEDMDDDYRQDNNRRSFQYNRSKFDRNQSRGRGNKIRGGPPSGNRRGFDRNRNRGSINPRTSNRGNQRGNRRPPFRPRDREGGGRGSSSGNKTKQ